MSPARTGGSITLELLIAFAVLSLTLTAVILMGGGNQGALARERAELSLAEDGFAGMRATGDFFSIISTTSNATIDDTSYGIASSVWDPTGCLKSVEVSATSSGMIGDGVSLPGWIADAAEMLALGDDCEAAPPQAAWKGFTLAEAFPVSGASATGLDTVAGTAYVALKDSPYLAIFDAGTWIPFDNGFALATSSNAIDAVLLHGKRYVYVTLATTSPGQLAVVDVSDSHNPVLTTTRSLAGVTAHSDIAYGYQVRYYDKRLYVSTEYIIGTQPELHVFDASDAAHPTEIGRANIETTINDMAIRSELADGVVRTYLYAATTNPGKELAVYDVTNPYAISATPIAVSDFGSDGGGKGGKSVAIRGTTLYFGRASNTDGPEFYTFDISKPAPLLTPRGSGEVAQKDVSEIVLAGDRAFLSAAFAETPSTRRIELWDVSDAAHLKRISQYPFPGMTVRGLDFMSDALYAAAASDPVLRIFHTP